MWLETQKLIKREIYEFHDGLFQIKRRDLIKEFAAEIDRVKEKEFERYEQNMKTWGEYIYPCAGGFFP